MYIDSRNIKSVHNVSFFIFYLSEAIANESVNSCLNETIEDLRPAMRTGISSLGLKPTDPLEINNLEIYRKLPAIDIQTKLKNVSIIN